MSGLRQRALHSLSMRNIDRAAALAQLGRVGEVKKAVDEILTVQPKFVDSPRRFPSCFILQDELVEQVLEGLTEAGLSR
jgi:hypothetical protein